MKSSGLPDYDKEHSQPESSSENLNQYLGNTLHAIA